MRYAANAAFSSSFNKEYLKMNEKAAFVFLITLILFQSAFGRKDDIHYLKNGISFSLSNKWKIVSDEPIPESGHYFSAERAGKNATGLFTLIRMDKEEDPSKIILLQQETLKNTNMYRNPGIEFTAIENSYFAGNECKKVQYVTIVKEQKLEGWIWCFNCSGRTIIVFFQTGIEDKKENLKGFDLIKQTFGC
jgi:hypothetical protein